MGVRFTLLCGFSLAVAALDPTKCRCPVPLMPSVAHSLAVLLNWTVDIRAIYLFINWPSPIPVQSTVSSPTRAPIPAQSCTAGRLDGTGWGGVDGGG